MQKIKKTRSTKIRQSAQGEECTLHITGVCNYDTRTTVLAHLPDELKGTSTKSDDFCACYACFDCHNVIDDRHYREYMSEYIREWYMRRAMVRTLRRLFALGHIKIT